MNAVVIAVFLLLAIGLPLLGVGLAGHPLRVYLEFPPLTRHVPHAPFSWPAFIALAAFTMAVVTPFVARVIRSRRSVAPSAAATHLFAAFPIWGWAGLAFGAAAWVLAWTRFTWFAPLQPFTFTPLWLAYVVVVNALAYRRSGRCMLTHRPRYLAVLFAASAGFWWFFEYLNRFVQNWYYVGTGQFTPLEYVLFATLPFSTVLPAVMGTYDLLATCPRLAAGLDGFRPARVRRPRWVAAAILVAAGASLAGIGVWPNLLFPLVWLSPLLILVCIEVLRGRETILSEIGRGDWRRAALLALAALICGFFWEMWNYHSLAKWIYAVPYVQRFHIFEMPLLGFAGYLPFGLECAVIAELVSRWDAGPDATADSARFSIARLGRVLAALLAAAAIWLPCLHLFFRPPLEEWFAPDGLPPRAAGLAARQLDIWSDPALREAEIGRMRSSNAEWDFMGRTYFVLALANMSFRNPAARAEYLAVMDRIIDETIRLERERGKYHFLMDYAREGAFLASAQRSLFQDGEIALMLGARRMVEEKEVYRPLLAERVRAMTAAMAESPVLSGESYPDECWTFCNTVALAAIRISDLLDGADHSAFLKRWVATARQRLTDSRTGLLISSFSFKGAPFDGPEGSSIWMAAHCLQIIDPEFAADQYRRARRELARSVLGFGYAVEWPRSHKGHMDIDSGPVIPLLKISAGSSGLAFVGAAAFGDTEYLRGLLTSLNFGGFPVRERGRLRFCASNAVGDAVLLYALVQGPLWDEVRQRDKEGAR